MPRSILGLTIGFWFNFARVNGLYTQNLVTASGTSHDFFHPEFAGQQENFAGGNGGNPYDKDEITNDDDIDLRYYRLKPKNNADIADSTSSHPYLKVDFGQQR